MLGKTRFEVNADVHNLFNANTPTSVTFASGPTFGQLNASSQNSAAGLARILSCRGPLKVGREALLVLTRASFGATQHAIEFAEAGEAVE